MMPIFTRFALLCVLACTGTANAAEAIALPFFNDTNLSSPVEWFLLVSALSFLPIFMISVTTFTRNIIVLSFLRQGLGLQQTPPNIILITLAFFLTGLTMAPTLTQSYDTGVAPYLAKKISFEQAGEKTWAPLRDFMVRQTHESELVVVHELAKVKMPEKIEELKSIYLIPAFLLSELKIAFQIGFIILLPFLLIDLVVASILMALGMIMVPPITISLPLKILLFLVVDGWALIAQTLVKSVAT